MEIFDLTPEDTISSCRKKAFAFASIFIIILAVYSNTFRASWHFDDEQNILHRKSVHMTNLTWPQVLRALSPEEKLY